MRVKAAGGAILACDIHTSFFYRLGLWSHRYRWLIIVFWAVVLAGSGALAPRVGSVLTSGFGEQDTEAHRGFALLEEEGILNQAVIILVFSHDTLTVEAPVYRTSAQTVLTAVSRYPGAASADSFFSTGNPNLVSPDGRTTFAVVGLNIPLDDVLDETPRIRATIPEVELDVWVTGGSAIFSDINEYTGRDLRRAEIITFPVVALALLLIFRTVVSVAAPITIGMMGLGITLAVIYLLGLVTSMSVFSMNTATLLGVGAAIDYSLLMVSRFREELEGRDVRDSVAVTVATAGRAILFSGITTALGLVGLLIFELSMLRSIGIGGIVVIGASVMVALTLVPALLSVLGRRIDALPILPASLYRSGRFWRTLAGWVIRRPLLIMVPVIVALLALGIPFLQVKLGIPWASVLPEEAESRQGWEKVSEELGEGALVPILVAARFEDEVVSPDSVAALHRYSQMARELPGVTRVESLVDVGPGWTLEQYQALYASPEARESPEVEAALREFGGGHVTMVSIYTDYEMNSDEARETVRQLRGYAGEGEFMVSGATASLMDAVDAMYDAFPWALALVTVSVYVVLMVLFRSVVIPLKALVMNGMSVFASYGALVFIFQQGRLEGVLNFTSTGFLEATIPILLFTILFGLSMDYEVFLLTRIKEIYDESGDNASSVALGLEKTGRIITSAALVLVLVAGSFTFGDIIIIKALGLGIALAICLDSTVVRALLAPALMKVLGDRNWWAPSPLRRVLPP